MKKARCYADRYGWTGFSDACNDVIIRIVIGQCEREHGISIVEQDGYSRSLGLGQSSAPGSRNPAFPGKLDCLCGLFRAFPFQSFIAGCEALGEYETGASRKRCHHLAF